MTLHNGIDTVAFISGGFYTETYGSSSSSRLANLFAFYGLLEDAPVEVVTMQVLIGIDDGKTRLRMDDVVMEI